MLFLLVPFLPPFKAERVEWDTAEMLENKAAVSRKTGVLCMTFNLLTGRHRKD